MKLTTKQGISPFFYLAIFSIATLFFSNQSFGHHDCAKYSKKINKLKAKMRQGYGVKQGEKLKAQLTKYQDLRFRCEKTKHQLRKVKATKRKTNKKAAVKQR